MEEIHKERAQKILALVPEDKRFYCQDGIYLSNLQELSDYLKKVKIEVYKNHVNTQKNDFANWIYDIIGDTELAEDIRKSKNRKELREVLRNRIDYLKIRVELDE
jgi:hypothetical protein